MNCTQLFPGLGTLICLGAVVRAPWAKTAPVPPPTTRLAAEPDKAAAAFLGLPDIRQAMGFDDSANDSQVFGDFVELIDPNAIHGKLDAIMARRIALARKTMTKEELAKEEFKKLEASLRETETLAREFPPTQPVPNWLRDEAGLMAQALATLGLKPGASKEEFLKAISARRNSRLGKALQTLSAGSGLSSTDRVERGITIDRFVTLGAFVIPGWNLVTLAANGGAEPSQLTGLARAQAAHTRESAIAAARSRAAGHVTTLSAKAPCGLTGLQRAIAANR